MARVRSRFICQVCGHESPRWMGKCPACESWNSFAEEVVPVDVKARVARIPSGDGGASNPIPLSEVSLVDEDRIRTGLGEFDRVMGGGIMQGSLNLLAGDPGIGKSTLMTELGKYLPEKTVLYVTGEESVRQVKLRAQRLGVSGEQMMLLAETNVDEIMRSVRNIEPDILVIDSVQTLFRPEIPSAPGSVTQVRESTAAVQQLTKLVNCATFLIGHVTKDGAIAGPRVLEHMVDTVLHFEGDRHHAFRILRGIKNRFGATNEIGVFEMRESGLHEVGNPSEIFLAERAFGISGSTVVCSMEGTRPLLVEVQALVTPASYGTPQRTATGFDSRRLQMLLAVLEKREGYRMSTHDVFLNVAGGVRINEPAVDLGVVVAAASSLRDVPGGTSVVVIGEVGLGGEIRAVSNLESRLREAARLGFEQAVVPAGSLSGLKIPSGLQVDGVDRLQKALDLLV